MSENIIQLFEESAHEYDLWFDRNRWVYESEIQALKKFPAPGGKSLEIGVGTGRFAAPLGIEVGVEPARAMARMAVKRGIKVVLGTGESLPFSPAIFQVVVLVTTICFLRDPVRALVEATRVLRPGGQILIGMLDRDSPLGRIYEARQQDREFYRLARFYAVTEVLDWLEWLAYDNVAVCQTIFKNPAAITEPEPIKDGHGEGLFAVISARRPEV
jgi:SAM-dependent methyltransferase